MKIYQLLDSVTLPVTNEEQNFIRRFDNHIKLTSLDEHELWLAQNLVRKGVYSIGKDNNTLVKKIDEIES